MVWRGFFVFLAPAHLSLDGVLFSIQNCNSTLMQVNHLLQWFEGALDFTLEAT